MNYRYDDRIRPISEMLPHERKEGAAAPCKAFLMVDNVIDGGPDNDKALDLLLKLFGNNAFYVTHNGSFHEYNISVWTMPSPAFYYNKYQVASPQGYSKKDILYSPLEGDGYVNDYSILYIKDALYNIYNRYSEISWNLMNSYTDYVPGGPHYEDARKVSKDELPDVIEQETVKAVRAWKLSKSNYNESVEDTKKGMPDTLSCEEDDDSGWSHASQVILLGDKRRHTP